MKRVIWLLPLLFLSACGLVPDRCTSDPNLPDCRANQAVANATIVAANAAADERARHAQMQATRDAVALSVQATQGAVNARATDAVVSAAATRSHLELDAAQQSVVFTATLQAAQFTIITTRTALEGDARINAALVQRDTAQTGQWLAFGIPSALLVGLSGYVLIYARKMGASLAAAVDVRANAIHYGYRHERLAYRVQRADGSLEFVPIDQILGHSDRYLDQLNVPDLAKLAALVEADKRLKGVHVAQSTGAFPVLSSTPDATAPQLSSSPAEPRAASLSGSPTFAEFLKTWRPTPDRLLFGYAEHGPLYGRLDQLLSVEIVGRQGQGKTTLLRLIYAQCLLIGVRVLVWDLHEDIVEDLPGAQTFTTAAAIEQAAHDLERELDRRIAEHDKTSIPIMALIDEINQLVNVVPVVAQVIGRVVNEGRKYQVFCIVSAKGIPANLFGNSTVRDAFSSRFAFQTTTRQATMIGFDREMVPAVRDLTPGRALFEGPVPAQVISVPFTSAADVKNILATSGPIQAPFFATSATSQEVTPHFQPPEAEVTVEVTPEVALTERHYQVRDLLRAGTPSSKIVQQVWGVGPGGRAYTQATAELTQIISELMR